MKKQQDFGIPKFGLIYDNEESIELFRNKPIKHLRIISAQKLDNIDSLDWIFIISTKDLAKEEFEKLKQNPALKVVIASERYDYLSQISNSYIEQKISQKDIYKYIKQIIETITIPCLVGLDYMDVANIFKDNTIMKIETFHSNPEHDDGFCNWFSFIGDVMLKNNFKKDECNVYIIITGGEKMLLDQINLISHIVELHIGKESPLVYGVRREEKLDEMNMIIFIGKKTSITHRNNSKRGNNERIT